MKIIIGVLGLQGAFYEHIEVLKKLKINYLIIRNKEEFNQIDGLIIPGGESTVMTKFINDLDLLEDLKKFILKDKKPVFGTCAGAILLSKIIINNNIKQPGLIPAIDCEITRNSYGRQIDSFIQNINIKTVGDFDCIFIRAPEISNCNECTIWATYNKNPIMVSKDNILICTFHPELINTRIHNLFIKNFIPLNGP